MFNYDESKTDFDVQVAGYITSVIEGEESQQTLYRIITNSEDGMEVNTSSNDMNLEFIENMIYSWIAFYNFTQEQQGS